MAENTTPTPSSDGYVVEGRELETDSLASTYPVNQVVADDEAQGFALQAQTLSAGEPARIVEEPMTAAAGDTSEMLGEVLQSQELNPAEPAVTNEPPSFQPAPSAAGYAAQGRALEQEAVAQAYPGQPAAAPQQPTTPYYTAPAGYAPQAAPQPQPTAAAAQSAYQAAYGAPTAAPVNPVVGAAPHPAQTYNPHAAATAAALQKTRTPLDPYRIFLICGMAVGAVMVIFGLCMLAFYTPAALGDFYNSSALGGQNFVNAGATAAQVLKAGFSLLFIGLGATDICAFGAKFAKKRCRDRAQK